MVINERVARSEVLTSNRANSAGVDCFLAFGLLAAASDTHRVGAGADRTIVVGSATPTPTGAMVSHPTTPYPELGTLKARLGEASRDEHNRFTDAVAVATGLFHTATTANILLLGVAVQVGEAVGGAGNALADPTRRDILQRTLRAGSSVSVLSQHYATDTAAPPRSHLQGAGWQVGHQYVLRAVRSPAGENKMALSQRRHPRRWRPYTYVRPTSFARVVDR